MRFIPHRSLPFVMYVEQAQVTLAYLVPQPFTLFRNFAPHRLQRITP